jgi:anti-sigma factor RsiW
MNCREISELAPLYLSGELRGSERDLFAAHLAECRECAAEMERYRAMDGRVRDALSDLPDATAVQRAMHRRIGEGRLRRWALLVATAAAAAVVAAVFTYQLLRPEAVFADAALDHQAEVVEWQPRHWRTDPGEIEKLAERYQLHDVASLAPAGYRLEYGKMCGLDGKPALHLVFTNGSQELSVYVRSRLSGRNGVRSTEVGSIHEASFQNDRVVVIAAGGSKGECLEFARVAANAL